MRRIKNTTLQNLGFFGFFKHLTLTLTQFILIQVFAKVCCSWSSTTKSFMHMVISLNSVYLPSLSLLSELNVSSNHKRLHILHDSLHTTQLKRTYIMQTSRYSCFLTTICVSSPLRPPCVCLIFVLFQYVDVYNQVFGRRL